MVPSAATNTCVTQAKESQFDELLQRNRGRFALIARCYAADNADDLLQEMLLQIWRGLDGFNGRSTLDTWCYRVALNTAISWRRVATTRKKRLPAESTDLGQLSGPTAEADEIELLHQFIFAVPA